MVRKLRKQKECFPVFRDFHFNTGRFGRLLFLIMILQIVSHFKLAMRLKNRVSHETFLEEEGKSLKMVIWLVWEHKPLTYSFDEPYVSFFSKEKIVLQNELTPKRSLLIKLKKNRKGCSKTNPPVLKFAFF